MEKTDSNFLYHTSCDNCGSSDANSVYDDGHSYCFSCNKHTKTEVEMETQTNTTSQDFITGDVKALSKRAIDLNTATKI